MAMTDANAASAKLFIESSPYCETQLVMNLIPDILKPYIGICKHLPVYSTMCRYIFGFHFFHRKLLDDPAVQAQSADCVPGEFPQPLSRPPDAARALECRAQFAFFPGDPNADEVAVVAARFARGPPRVRRVLALSYGLTPGIAP